MALGNLSPEQLVAVVYVAARSAPTRSRRKATSGAHVLDELYHLMEEGRHDLRRRHAAGDPGLGRRRPRQGRRGTANSPRSNPLPHPNRTSNSRAAGSGCFSNRRTWDRGPLLTDSWRLKATPPPSTISTFAGSSTTTLVESIMTLSVADLTVDLSKHRVSAAVLDDLTALANEVGLADRFAAMIAGSGSTRPGSRRAPYRSAGSVGSRCEKTARMSPAVHEVLGRIGAFADRSGPATGSAPPEPIETSSTSGSVAPTSVRSWRTKRSLRFVTTGFAAASSAMSTAAI